MKSILNFLLLYLILSIEARLQIEALQKDVVTTFSNDKETQNTIDYTLCVEIIQDPEYLSEIQKRIDEGEFPEGSDLLETALAVCQQLSQTDEFQSRSSQLLPAVKSQKIPVYSPNSLNKAGLVPKSKDLVIQLKIGWFAVLLLTMLVGCLERAINKLIDKYL